MGNKRPIAAFPYRVKVAVASIRAGSPENVAGASTVANSLIIAANI